MGFGEDERDAAEDCELGWDVLEWERIGYCAGGLEALALACPRGI